MLMSSPTITLFSERSDPYQQPTSFVASILVHALVIGFIYFAVLNAPRIDNRVAERYAMRQLDFHMPEPLPSHSSASHLPYPGPLSASHSLASVEQQPAHLPVRRRIPNVPLGPQTLLQPDLRNTIALKQEIPLPRVILWSASKLPVTKIVSPLPHPLPAASVTPSIEMPNQEINLGNIPLASTSRLTLHPLAAASTTTPIVTQQQAQPLQATPATVSQSSLPPQPAAVMALSDLRMTDANVALPPVNEATSGNDDGLLTAGVGKPSPATDNSASANSSAGHTAPAGGGNKPAHEAGANAPASSYPPSQSASAGSGQASTGSSGTGQGNRPSAARIELPINGHFGAVVVGSSLQDQFPEMGDVWSGRMAYTVYLHVGLPRSWILQYSLPRSADAGEAGAIAPLDAPWPYNIVRPNLPPGAINADALLVHGFVNRAGRFEALNIVFPPAFPQAAFVLQSLAQWQFRPAAQAGQPIRVEVLLIIPDEED